MKALIDLAADCAANSERWFPHLHEGPQTERLKHMTLGLCEEAGEVAGVIKKLTGYKPGQAKHSGDQLSKLGPEMADVLIYLLNIAHEMNIDLDGEVIAKTAVCEARWGTKDEPQAKQSAQDRAESDETPEISPAPPETAEGHTEAERPTIDQIPSAIRSMIVPNPANGVHVGDEVLYLVRYIVGSKEGPTITRRKPSPLPPPAPTKTTGEVLAEIRERLTADHAHVGTRPVSDYNTGRRESLRYAIECIREAQP